MQEKNKHLLRLDAIEAELFLMRRLLDLQTPLVEMALRWLAEDQEEKMRLNRALDTTEHPVTQ